MQVELESAPKVGRIVLVQAEDDAVVSLRKAGAVTESAAQTVVVVVVVPGTVVLVWQCCRLHELITLSGMVVCTHQTQAKDLSLQHTSSAFNRGSRSGCLASEGAVRLEGWQLVDGGGAWLFWPAGVEGE